MDCKATSSSSCSCRHPGSMLATSADHLRRPPKLATAPAGHVLSWPHSYRVGGRPGGGGESGGRLGGETGGLLDKQEGPAGYAEDKGCSEDDEPDWQQQSVVAGGEVVQDGLVGVYQRLVRGQGGGGGG